MTFFLWLLYVQIAFLVLVAICSLGSLVIRSPKLKRLSTLSKGLVSFPEKPFPTSSSNRGLSHYLDKHSLHYPLFNKQVANLSWDSELDTGRGKDFLFLFDLLSHTSGIEATLRLTIKLLQLCSCSTSEYIRILFEGSSLMQMRRSAGSVCLRWTYKF